MAFPHDMNPWTVWQRGAYAARTPEEHFQFFLKWQDHERWKLRTSIVEKDVENLRSGGGEQNSKNSNKQQAEQQKQQQRPKLDIAMHFAHPAPQDFFDVGARIHCTY